MSLQYIIDGYNITNHRLFSRKNNKKIQEPKKQLLELIRIKRLCGSRKNKATVVFDGYPEPLRQREDTAGIEVIFSRGDSADERIRQMLERSANVKNIIVVSDDKEIRLFTKFFGARPMSIEEFIRPEEDPDRKRNTPFKPELTYSQMSKINQELRKIWLKA